MKRREKTTFKTKGSNKSSPAPTAWRPPSNPWTARTNSCRPLQPQRRLQAPPAQFRRRTGRTSPHPSTPEPHQKQQQSNTTPVNKRQRRDTLHVNDTGLHRTYGMTGQCAAGGHAVVVRHLDAPGGGRHGALGSRQGRSACKLQTKTHTRTSTVKQQQDVGTRTELNMRATTRVETLRRRSTTNTQRRRTNAPI